MRNAINKFKTEGFQFSKGRVEDKLIYYTGLRGRSVFELADMGYQSSPSIFDEISFRTYILKTYPQIRKYLVGSSDDSFKLQHVQLAIMKANNAELKHILELYYNILISNEFISLVKRLSDSVGFKKSKDITEVQSRLCLNGKVDNYGKVPLDDELCYEALYVPEGKAVKSVCFTNILREHLLKRLGLEDTDNTSKFIKDISLNDELELFNFILSGCCECDGEFGDALHEDIARHIKHYKDINSSALSVPEYSSEIFTESIDDITKYTSDIISSENGTYFFITNTKVYYLVDDTSHESKYFKNGVLNVGAYCVDTYNKVELPKIANLLGLCGEFYPSSMLFDDMLQNDGHTFKLYTYNGKKKPLVYEYESSIDIHYKDGGASISPVINDISEVNFRVDNEEWWGKIKSRSDSLLIAELTNALVQSEYGSFKYRPIELTDFNISDDQFIYAAYKAEELFHSLGF